MKNRRTLLVGGFVSFLVITSANASPLGPVYPAPGNNSFSATGSYLSGTKVATYGGFDVSQFGQLWWGPEVGASMDGSSPPDMTAVTISNGGQTATWTGTTTLLTQNWGVQTVQVEFIGSFVSGGSWTDAGPLGIAGVQAVTQVTGDFTLDEEFLAQIQGHNTGLLPFITLYQDYKAQSITNQLANTNFNGEFFYTAPSTDVAATPLPAALPLFVTGLGGLGLLGWRRKRKAQAVG